MPFVSSRGPRNRLTRLSWVSLSDLLLEIVLSVNIPVSQDKKNLYFALSGYRIQTDAPTATHDTALATVQNPEMPNLT